MPENLELLDRELATPKIELSRDHGYFFSRNQRTVAWLVAIAGLLMILTHNILSVAGVILLLSGAYATLSRSGVQLDVTKGLVRSYIDYWRLIKKGKWQDLDAYAHITILSKRMSAGMESQSARRTKESFQKYEVTLLTEDHRSKFLLSVFDTYEEAKVDAVQLSEMLGKPLGKYAPKQFSKKRRR